MVGERWEDLLQGSVAAGDDDEADRFADRAAASRAGELTGHDRFAKAADMHMDRLRELVAEGRRSPGTIEQYESVSKTTYARPWPS